MSSNYQPLVPADAAILLVDHQPGVINMIGSLPHELVISNAATLARLGEQTDDLPLVLTTTREDVPFLGTTIPEIQNAAPVAYANRIARGGSLDAFSDPRLVERVKGLNRNTLVIGGVLTDVCLFNTVISALGQGYRVVVAADASGTSTELADAVTYDRLRAAGAEIASTWGVLFELYNDLSTDEGQRAEAIASASVVPA